MDMFHVAYRCHCGLGLVVPRDPSSANTITEVDSIENPENLDVAARYESLEEGLGACPDAALVLHNEAEGLWAAVSSLLPVSFNPSEVPTSGVWGKWADVRLALSVYYTDTVGKCLIDHIDDDDTEQWLENEYASHVHHSMRNAMNTTCAVVPWYSQPLTVAMPYGMWVYRLGPSLLVDVCAGLGDDCDNNHPSIWKIWCEADGVRVFILTNSILPLQMPDGLHFFAVISKASEGKTHLLPTQEWNGVIASVEVGAQQWTWTVTSDEATSASFEYWRLTVTTPLVNKPVVVKCGLETEFQQQCVPVAAPPGQGPCAAMFIESAACVWWTDGGQWIGASFQVHTQPQVIMTCTLA